MQIFIKAPYDRFVTTDSRFGTPAGGREDRRRRRPGQHRIFAAIIGGLAFQTPDSSLDDPAPPEPRLPPVRQPRPRPSNKSPHHVLTPALHRIGARPVGGRAGGFPRHPGGEVTAIAGLHARQAADLGPAGGVKIFPGRMRARNRKGLLRQGLPRQGLPRLRRPARRPAACAPAAQRQPGHRPALRGAGFLPGAGAVKRTGTATARLPTSAAASTNCRPPCCASSAPDKLPSTRSAATPARPSASAAPSTKPKTLSKRLDGLTSGDVRETVVDARKLLRSARSEPAPPSPTPASCCRPTPRCSRTCARQPDRGNRLRRRPGPAPPGRHPRPPPG